MQDRLQPVPMDAHNCDYSTMQAPFYWGIKDVQYNDGGTSPTWRKAMLQKVQAGEVARGARCRHRHVVHEMTTDKRTNWQLGSRGQHAPLGRCEPTLQCPLSWMQPTKDSYTPHQNFGSRCHPAPTCPAALYSTAVSTAHSAVL